MKALFIFLILSLLIFSARSQGIDTLRNHSDNLGLVAFKYTAPNSWGYYLGHNSNFRQQFAEKYIIEGSAKVLGVISHHTGTYAHPNNKVEYNIFNVGSNRYPSDIIGSKEVLYQNLDLSGEAMTTLFDAPVEVVDSFFVSFNLFDYAHGGYEGDTISLLCSPDGSRTSDVFMDLGRNVLQFHNHSTVAWRDYATQNFTPSDKDMVHLALYPIVEFTNIITGLKDQFAEASGLRITAPFPNPSSEDINIGFTLSFPSLVVIKVMDLQGKLLQYIDKGMVSSGENHELLDVSNLQNGNYIVLVQTDKGSLASTCFVI